MDTWKKQIIIILVATFVCTGCAYDLDVTGFFGTEDPVRDRFMGSLEYTATYGTFELRSDTTMYSILIGGDAHVGTGRNLETMLQQAVSQDALAIAVAGDVTTGRAEDMHRTDSIFSLYPEVEKYMVPGNHDLYFGGWKTYFELFGPSTYTLKVYTGDTADLYIFLDSGSGTLGRDQVNWLKTVLEADRPSFRYATVVTHLNFFRNRLTGSTNPLNEEIVMLIDLFAANNVQMVIQGHDHLRFETRLGETTYLTLDALRDGEKNASYLELKVDEEGIRTQFQPF